MAAGIRYPVLVPQTAACFVFWFACYFLFSLGSKSFRLFTSSGVSCLCFSSTSFSSRSFQVSATSPGGGARQGFLSISSFSFFSLDQSPFCFVFVLFYFVSLVYRMCMSCLSYPHYYDRALHCPMAGVAW